MKKYFAIITLCFLSFASCKKSKSSTSSSTTEVPPSDISLSASTTSASINLSWVPVSGCSWYKIYSAKQGNTPVEIANYQNLTSNPITYTISGLSSNTTYEIKMEGTDYASGGKLLASKTIVATTIP